jgi:ABC-type bacteriocin/lantibiotic exporter with double-glycine peptidase domain
MFGRRSGFIVRLPFANEWSKKEWVMKKLLVTFIAAFVVVLLSNSKAIEQQQALNWCWAASVQDVLAQAGIYQSQTDIAARLDGWPQNRPAYIQELVLLLRSYGLTAWQAGRPGSPQELYSTLRSGWKIIAFVRPSNGPIGHYIVLEGIDQNGYIYVADPATGITNLNPIRALYYGWRWIDSVVVRI